jgi:hypothetical protein
VIQNWYSQTEQTLNEITEAATPGRVMIIWGTGLGPVTGDEATQAPLGQPVDAGAKVFVAGREVTPSYQGRSGCCAGVDQIVFTVPEGVNGCYVPVMVRTGNVVSNTVTMAVAPGRGGCRDDFSFGGADPNQFRGGSYSFGSVSLSRISTSFMGTSMDIDSAGGVFTRYNFADLLRTHGNVGVSTYGACTVYTFSGNESGFKDPVPPTYLDAGATLTLTTPNGAKTLRPLTKGVYTVEAGTGLPVPWLVQGTYTISGPGGTDVSAFSQQLTVPAPLTWTNPPANNEVSRSAPLPVNWTGGGSQGTVMISGTSAIFGTSETDLIGAGFICLANAAAGTFTVPAEVLMALPVSAASEGFPTGSLLVGSMNSVPITPKPSQLQHASFGYQFMTSRGVSYK